MINRWRILVDRMTLYLPVMLMGLFALGTYWLVRSTPMLLVRDQAVQVRHEPDYFMHNFSVKSFDSHGGLKTHVRGAEARHFPDSDTLEIGLFSIHSFGDAGSLTEATARRAVTNVDATEVQLFGQARVVRVARSEEAEKQQPRIEFRSEFLHAYMDTERFLSDRPVELMRGNDRFTADSMEFDNIKRFIDIKGRVKGRLLPPSSK